MDGNEITTAGTAVNYVTEDGKVFLASDGGVILSDATAITTDVVAEGGIGEGDEIVIAAGTGDDEDIGKEEEGTQSTYIIQGQDDYKVLSVTNFTRIFVEIPGDGVRQTTTANNVFLRFNCCAAVRD